MTPGRGQLRLGVLASHRGSTLGAILEAGLPVALAIGNNSDSGALRRARQAGVQARHISGRTHPGAEAGAIAEALREAGCNAVVLAGYMKLLGAEVLQAFPGAVVNTHPALLPKHGGQGMYGDHVHAAVLAGGERESGATLHLVDEEYDRGPILRQARVAVLPGDDVAALRARVQGAERALLVGFLAELRDAAEAGTEIPTAIAALGII